MHQTEIDQQIVIQLVFPQFKLELNFFLLTHVWYKNVILTLSPLNNLSSPQSHIFEQLLRGIRRIFLFHLIFFEFKVVICKIPTDKGWKISDFQMKLFKNEVLFV